MSLHPGYVFIYILSFLGTYSLPIDSFFPERYFPRPDSNPFLYSNWRRLFPTEKIYKDSSTGPILDKTQGDGLHLPDFNYPILLPDIFNDSKLFSNLFLDGIPGDRSNILQPYKKESDAVNKPKNVTKNEAADNVTAKFEKEDKESQENVTLKRGDKRVGRGGSDRGDGSGTVKPEGKIETETSKTTKSEGTGETDIVESATSITAKSEGKGETDIAETATSKTTKSEESDETETEETTVKYEKKETETKVTVRETESKDKEGNVKNYAETKDESTEPDQDMSVGKVKNPSTEIKEDKAKQETDTEKTSFEHKIDDEERTSTDAKVEEVSIGKTNLGAEIENKSQEEQDNNEAKIKETRRNERENRKINLKPEIEDKNKKQIMSVENNEKQSDSNKEKEETTVKNSETNEERTSEGESNEMINEDTKQIDELLKTTNGNNESRGSRNDSHVSRIEKGQEENNIEDLNRTKQTNHKVQETLTETLPDELSNSDLDVLQDNSTNFICLTDSSKCLSKSTSILLTTGILIAIIVGLVTIVGITTGLSVYIFHRWKLRKKSPRGKSNVSNMIRSFTPASRRTNKSSNKRSVKRKSGDIEENDSPINTLEAITVHNYREGREHTYNL